MRQARKKCSSILTAARPIRACSFQEYSTLAFKSLQMVINTLFTALCFCYIHLYLALYSRNPVNLGDCCSKIVKWIWNCKRKKQKLMKFNVKNIEDSGVNSAARKMALSLQVRENSSLSIKSIRFRYTHLNARLGSVLSHAAMICRKLA